MKTKINKILGVALALVLVFGLAGAFIPVNMTEAADPGTTHNQWQAITIPTAAAGKVAAADCTDIAIAADGKTMYVADTQAGALYISTSQGLAWTNITATLAASPGYIGPPRLVDVSPDDPNAVAVVDSSPQAGAFAAGTVFISNNGGTTWAALNRVPGAAAGNTVTGVAVGPSRAGTILGRDYAVSVADNAAGFCNGGDILFQGLNTAWTSCVGAGAIAVNTFDFTSIIESPGYLGDRCFIAVGSDTVVTVNDNGAAGDTYLFIIQTSDVAPLATVVAPPGAVRLDTATTDSPGDWALAVSGIQASDVDVPADFDPTVTSGRRTFVSWTSFGGPVVNFDDVYRVDNQTVRKLQTGAANGIWSIAFSGTITGGTLLCGESIQTAAQTILTHHTEDPQVSQPSWTTSAKSPTGNTNCVVGIDPADAMIAYAGTTGIESAFSRSTNGAVSFNGVGLVDTVISSLADVMPVPDGSKIFLSTAQLPAPLLESLWRSSTPPSAASWERVRLTRNNWAAQHIIRVSPEWDDVPAVYWMDRAGPSFDIERSLDGGEIFSRRIAPVATITDATVENADIVHLIDGATGNYYKTTNGGWFFGLPIATGGPGTCFDIEMLPSYPHRPVPGNLIRSTTAGAVKVSTNGGDSWSSLSPSVAGAINPQVIGDVDWANNSTVYMGSATAGQGIYRFTVGTSTNWENIDAFPAIGVGADLAAGTLDDIWFPVTGLAMFPDVLYGAWGGRTVGADILPFTGDDAAAAPSGADRSLVPDIPVIASWTFEVMNVGAAASSFSIIPNSIRSASSDTMISLWAIDVLANAGAGAVMAYADTMALAKLDVTVPDIVPIDSVLGRNQQFTVSWGQISNATDYNIEIYTDPGCTQRVWSMPAPPIAPFFVPPNPLSPAVVVPVNTLSAGQDYFLRARIRDQIPNDAIRNNWSSVYRFSVEGGERVEVSYLGVQPLGPTPGATGVPLSPGFTWSPYAKSTRYEFKLAKDAGMTDIIAEAKVSTTGYKYDGTLANNTTFFWMVRGIEPTSSDWSPVASFTTEKKEREPTPPVVIEPTPPAEPVVSQTMIYVIIGVGVVLVIAVIVLIVRTRRTV